MSTILFTAAGILLTAAAAAIGFFAGRASVPGDHAPVIPERSEAATTTSPGYAFPVADEATQADLRAQLLDVLDRPAEERNRAIRVAMNAWLAAEGAAALTAVRGDPELGEVANRMTHFALFAYPELFVEDQSLLEGVPDARQSVAKAARAMAMFDPDAAHGMVNTRLSGSMFGDAVLKEVDRIDRAGRDPRAELESLLEEQDWLVRIERLFELVVRVAADDPAAAAELLEDLPARLKQPATLALVGVWSSADPEEAARWLTQKDAQVPGESLGLLAQEWGKRDFEAANAFADTLTGRKREVFLTGLAGATEGSKEELLAWVSRYEGEPAYPDLMVSVVRRFAQEDVGAAMALIETLPERIRLASHRSVVRSLAFGDPEAAVALMEEIGNESLRDDLAPMVSGLWARNDAVSAVEWAGDLSPGRSRDQAFASIISSLVNFEPDPDIDHVIEVIDEIEDPELRKSSIWLLLTVVTSDDEAIRLGRDHSFDRDHVLAIRGSISGVMSNIMRPAYVPSMWLQLKDADPE